MAAEETRYGVQIRSWQVPGAANHYYGRIWRYGPGRARAEEEIRFRLTADEASALNEKDNDGWGVGTLALRRGDECGRYSDRERLIRDAVRRLAELWDYHGELEDGDEAGYENPVLERPKSA